ncbi:unnamed protein product [Symbiodinium sp. CCMP2456]|nr:unnamed protein product [Symbiodinium sp. CCMP2456]
MVLDICPELYVGGNENHLWQPENEETQRRRWLAPKEAPTPVSAKEPKVPKAVAATTVAPAALCSAPYSTPYSYVLGHAPGHELSRTYAARSVAGRFPCHTKTIPNPAVKMVASTATSIFDRSRCPAVHMQGFQRGAPPVYVIRPVVYVQSRAAPLRAHPMIRETSFLGGYRPMTYSQVYVRSRVILPPRVLVRA